MSGTRQSVVRTYAARHTGAYTIPEHTHDWSQLIYPQAGVIAVRTSAGSWIVPPERGVWVPRGVSHSIEIAGQTSMCSLYFPPGFAPRLPKECAVVAIPPLLRELILHANRIGTLHRAVPAHERLIGVMLDQIRVLPQLPLDLPMPRDARALRAARLLRDTLGETAPLDRIARAAGASKRTLERRFRAETGMGLGRWRQQLRLLHALRRLAEGEPVTSVALESGYRSASAFISMFKNTLGSTPLRYRRDAN